MITCGEAGKGDAAVQPQLPRPSLEIPSRRALPHDQEARLLEPPGHRIRRLQEILEPLEAVQTGHGRHHGNSGWQSEGLPQAPWVPKRLEAQQVDAIPDHSDGFATVAFRDQLLPHRLRVDQRPVCQAAAGEALDASLRPSPDVAAVPNGRQDDRDTGEPGRREGENVGIEAIGVHDLEPVRPQVAPEALLLQQSPPAEQVPDGETGDGDSIRLDRSQELAALPQTGEMRLEARAIQPPCEGHGVALRPARLEAGQEMQEPNLPR